MYCHLCHTEVSAIHNSSSGHRAARELAAAVLDRLTNHLAASGDPEGSTNVQADAEKTSVKTPEAVSFCDTCNAVYPINELSSHYRQKKHALALLSEQEFEELVNAYVGGEQKETSEASDDVALVDEAEAVNTYTCQLCALEVPRVFRAEHERGFRHRASRTFALAAARRARDVFATTDRSGDGSGDKARFSGKMMKRLLKAYTGRSDEVDITEEPEAKLESEPNSTKPEPKLTPKEYFTNILPFLPYVGTLNVLYIDNTKFVTIKVGNETLKIHVNNLNGLYNVDGNDDYYMCCRLCDRSSNIYYGSKDQQDKCHVMSLGHIRNVMSPVDNVHLIRKVDDTHYICGLCNVHIYPNIYAHDVENHIFKDPRHTLALTEALELGKDFKETKDHMKIMIYTPPVPAVPKPSVFKPNQVNQKWTFGIPQQRQERWSSGLFGTRNTGTVQDTGYGTQGQSFGSNQSTFGSASVPDVGFGGGNAPNTVFGNSGGQNTTFGGVSAQNSGFGSNNTSFGNASSQNTGFSLFGPRNNTGSFGVAQNNATSFGASSNTASGFGVSPKNPIGFGASSNTVSGFGASPNNATGFGAAQNNANRFSASHSNNAPGFGASPKNSTGFGAVQNNATSFGASSNTASGFGASPKNPTDFGASSNTVSGFGASPNNATDFGAAQNNSTGVGPDPIKTTGSGAAQINATLFGVSQNVIGGNQNSATGFGSSLNNSTRVGPVQKNGTTFGAAQNKPTAFGATQKNPSGIGATLNNANSGAVQNSGFSFGDTQKDTSSSAEKQNESKKINAIVLPPKSLSPFDIRVLPDKKPEAVGDTQRGQNIDANQSKNEGRNKKQRPKEPPKRLNYSSSSDSDYD